MDFWNKQFSSPTVNKDIIMKIVDNGIKLMNNNTTEQQFQIWVNYAKELLDLAIKRDNLGIKANFLEIVLSTYRANLLPYQKISYCTQYLLDVVKKV